MVRSLVLALARAALKQPIASSGRHLSGIGQTSLSTRYGKWRENEDYKVMDRDSWTMWADRVIK